MAFNSKIDGHSMHRAKWVEIWDSRGEVEHTLGTFDLSVQFHFMVIWCTYLIMAWNSKMAGFRAKWIEIGDSLLLVERIWGTFYLVLFKVFRGSFGVLVSKWPVTRKPLAVE